MVWCGDCLQCEAPETEAPELLAPLNDENMNTYFLRQPRTPEELSHACMAARVCCVSALRYGGRDISIIKQLQNNPEVCDFMIAEDGQLQLTVDAKGDFLPFAQKIVDKHHAEMMRDWQKRNKKWWQFWL